MKTARLFLIVVFMLTFFTIPAQAQAGEHYGFVPLVTQVNASTPLRVQSQRALNRLMPKLMAAQQSGTILEFKPELEAGILKIKYAAGVKASTLGSAQVLDSIQAAAATVKHPASVSTKAVSGFSPSFWLTLYSSCFTITNVNTNSYVIASLRTQSGVVVANFAGNANSSGQLASCFDYSGAFTEIVPGYKVTYKVYDSTGVTLLGTYAAAAPTISFTTINKTTSVAGGSAPKNKPFEITWYHDLFNAADSTIIINKTGTVPATGKWSVDFGTVKFRGTDFFDMSVTQSVNFSFGISVDVPSVYCAPGTNYCSLHTFPLQSASLSLTHAGVTYTVTGHADGCGCFHASFFSATGAPIIIAGGDKVSGTGVPLYVLPKLTAAPNYATDKLIGKAPASKYFQVGAEYVYVGAWVYKWAGSNASGIYTADFSSDLDFIPGDVLTFDVYYVDPVTGNQTDAIVLTGP